MLSDKPIVLMGFMGSGKTTLGKQLAALLGYTFIDLDRFIETEENRTIPEIFERDGEAAFRKLESNALNRILIHPNQVISIGGGAPCQPGNMEVIREKSLSVYLKVSEPQLLQRLARSSTTRPLLSGKSESEMPSVIANLLAGREPYYRQAHIIMESDAISPAMILAELERGGPEQ